MRCPRCNQQFYQINKPCPICHFSGDHSLLEELGHIGWLLDKKDIWQPSPTETLPQLRQKYINRKKELEIELGLRLRPFTRAEAEEAWPKLIQQQTLLQQVAAWMANDLLHPAASQTMVDVTRRQVDELLERMEGHLRSAPPQTDADRLELTDYLLAAIEQLSRLNGFVSPEAEDLARAPLLVQKEAFEINLGLRQEPVPEPAVIEATPATPVIVEEPVSPVQEEQPAPLVQVEEERSAPPAPPIPRTPLRERLWQMLLSERTLQAMLFLGIFLLFSAALSFVAWGWKDFSAPLRVAIPTGFTSAFFALGWYVRTKTPMYRSGIALSAIAALLIPIDFYTVYVNFHIPAAYWPLFWFITSLTCVIAYIVTTLMIRSQFFGYLVGVAAGSTVLALVQMGHQSFGLSLEWRSTALSSLCLGLTILATGLTLPLTRADQLTLKQIFANPLRYLALGSAGIIMLLTFGWRFTPHAAYDGSYHALTLNWWLGSLIFGWNAAFYKNRRLGELTAITLPISLYLAQASLFDHRGLSPGWHAFGWAWLTALYFGLGYRLGRYEQGAIQYSHGRTAVRFGLILMIIATIWPLLAATGEARPAAATHTVLAGVVVLITLLWQRPAYLYGASVFLFSATTLAMADMGLTLAQLGVGWASLAIVHIMIALILGTRFPSRGSLTKPLVIAGYLVAALAIFPPIFPYQGGLLTYTLGNWLALTGWGARLAHLKLPGFSSQISWRKPVFHWLTALSLPFWLWIGLSNVAGLNLMRSLALVVLAWLMLVFSYRLNRFEPIYRRPWYISGLLITLAAPMAAFATAPHGFVPAITLLLVGLLYFFDAAFSRQSLELAPGGVVTAWGYFLLLDRLNLAEGLATFGFGLLIAGYILVGLRVEQRNSVQFTRRFLSPLYLTAHLLAVYLLVWIYLHPLNRIVLGEVWTDQTRLWQAASQFLLAGIYGLYAWKLDKVRWAHLAVWLMIGGSSFVVISYSTSDGASIAAEMALVATACIFLERRLYRQQRRQEPITGQSEFIRLAWKLWKQPLLVGGWAVSGGVIALSFLYILAGDRAAEMGAAVALLLIAGLYGISTALFQQPRLAWLAAGLSFVPWTLFTDLSWSAIFSDRSEPTIYILSWSLLAWGLFLGHLPLTRLQLQAYAHPLRIVAQILLGLSLLWSLTYAPSTTLPQFLGLLLIGLLYFADAVFHRYSPELAPGVLVTTWGYSLLLAYLNLSFDEIGFGQALLTTFFITTGLWVERRRSTICTQQFLAPLYLTAHLVTGIVLWRIYIRPFDNFVFDIPWTDAMRLWGAAGQLILGVVYGCYAWVAYKERWGHFAAWLLALSGGLIAITYSSGSGSSTAKIAVAAIAFVLAERALHRLRQRSRLSKRQQAFIRLTWRLYHSPLLVTGWILSAGVIGLALIRNLLWLGGEMRQFWAALALLLITALYALSARLFRQARFLWLAGVLIFIPWTILTHLGWFTSLRPTLPGYGLSWALLAWLLLLLSLPLTRRKLQAYALPLEWIANILLAFSLLWSSVEVATGRFTFILAIGFYGLGSLLNHRQFKAGGQANSVGWRTKFFYPTLILIPIWCAYLIAWLLPEAQAEHYGLMLLVFGPLGLAVGQGLYRLAPEPKAAAGYAFPAHLTGYGTLTIGTILVVNQPALLALALLFDALLMLVSARLFKRPVWIALAVIFAPLSLWLALQESVIAFNRYGWWLIGLASIYLVSAWLLRRLKRDDFGTAPLAASFSLIAAGLVPSSLDQTGALWGYGSAVILYTISAFWLRYPLFLTPAAALAMVPYMIMLQKSPLPPAYYGLAFMISAMGAIFVGWKLDRHFGPVKDFPWAEPAEWLLALITRLLTWWAFPLYAGGFGLAIISPFFAQSRPGLLTLSFLLMMLLFGWAVYRFRLRGWLIATTVAWHLAAIYLLETIDWWGQPDPGRAWLGYLPVTIIMVAVTLIIRFRLKEHLFESISAVENWTKPLYIITLLDITFGQLWSLRGTSAGVAVTITHALLIGLLASTQRSPKMVYVSLSLGVVAIRQMMIALDRPLLNLPVLLSLLSLGYGLAGYGLAWLRANLDKDRELRPWIALWELPLQRSGIVISLGTLVLAGWLGTDLLVWSGRALFGLPFRVFVEPAIVQMVVGVFGFQGLLYVSAAFTHRWSRLGYIAIGMLLTAWLLHVFYIQQRDSLRQIQWYAIPAGLYLLGIAYLEWQQGNRTLGRWLDYSTMILMLGSLFWQTLLFGWVFSMLLGTEGLLGLLWGSARRLRRFLYAGMSAVVLATVGQLLNSLQSINQWIVFGIVGLSLVLVAIIVERKLEDIKAWREILETWE